MATVQSTSTDDPQDGYVAPPRSPKDRRFSSSKEPTSKGMHIRVCMQIFVYRLAESGNLSPTIQESWIANCTPPLSSLKLHLEVQHFMDTVIIHRNHDESSEEALQTSIKEERSKAD